MTKTTKTKAIAWLVVGALASGCASGRRAPDAPHEHEQPAAQTVTEKGPNPGGQIAGGCGYVALRLTAETRLVGLPLGVGILAFCLPVALASAVLHEVLPHGMGGPAVLYSDPAQDAQRKLDDAERSVFPQSSTSGCRSAYCLAAASSGYR